MYVCPMKSVFNQERRKETLVLSRIEEDGDEEREGKRKERQNIMYY